MGEPEPVPEPGAACRKARLAVMAAADRAVVLMAAIEADRTDDRVFRTAQQHLRVFRDAVIELTRQRLDEAASGGAISRAADEAYARGFADGAAARGRHRAPKRGERPQWLRALPAAVPLGAGLRHAGGVLGHHAASSALAGSAVAASAVLVIGASGPVPHPAPVPSHAVRAPAAIVYGAVRIPAAPSSSPPARTDARSASPAPSVTPPAPARSLPPAPPPSPPPPAWVPPALSVPRVLDLGAMTTGPLTLTAGPDAVTWTVTATDGITVSANGHPVTGETLAAGQRLDLTVFAPAGGGVIYFSAGPRTWAVVVSSDLAPALALPSGL